MEISSYLVHPQARQLKLGSRGYFLHTTSILLFGLQAVINSNAWLQRKVLSNTQPHAE
jgi:hypothetical protein